MSVGQNRILMFPLPHRSAKSMDEDKRWTLANIKIGNAMVVDSGDLIGHTLDQFNPGRKCRERGTSQDRQASKPEHEKEK